MQDEEWRPIEGFPGYEVSTYGRVLSHRRGKPRILGGGIGERGYRHVGLHDTQGKQRTTNVHRVVALTFLGPRPEGAQIRHLDGDRLNNRLDNLAFGTASENALDRTRHGRCQNANKTHCPQGHGYTPENTHTRLGMRHCKTCRRERQRLGSPPIGAARG